MPVETRNIMVFDYDSKTTEFIKDLFPETCTVTPVRNLDQITPTDAENCELFLAGYVVPGISGNRITSYFNDIQKALDGAHSDLREKTDALKSLMEERKQREQEILSFLRDHVRRAEEEKVRLKREIEMGMETVSRHEKEMQKAREEAETAVKAQKEAEAIAESAVREKQEAEKMAEDAALAQLEAEKQAGTAQSAAEEASKATAQAEQQAEAARKEQEAAEAGIAELREADAQQIKQLQAEVRRLTDEVEKAMALLEQSRNEKAAISEKLTKLQENWEKYVAGA